MLDLILVRQARAFWNRVDVIAGDAECWPWMGKFDRDGYGRLTIKINGQQHELRTHRVAYSLERGAIPEGLVLDHLCRNRACCNPAHLEPVTSVENVRRGAGHRELVLSVAELIELYRAGWSLERLAAREGVSRGCVTYRLRNLGGVQLRGRGRPKAA